MKTNTHHMHGHTHTHTHTHTCVYIIAVAEAELYAGGKVRELRESCCSCLWILRAALSFSLSAYLTTSGEEAPGMMREP